jgi:hypothetical protein
VDHGRRVSRHYRPKLGYGGFKEKTKAGVIGEINKEEILFEDFQTVVQRQIDAEQRKSEGELDQNQIKRIAKTPGINTSRAYES